MRRNSRRPNIVCLAGAVAGEFRYTGKDGNILQGVTALPGTPAATTWPAGTYAFPRDRGIRHERPSDARSMFATTQTSSIASVYETDAAGNTLEIHQVYIPPVLRRRASRREPERRPIR